MIKLSDNYRESVKHVIRPSSYLENNDKWWMLHAIGLVPMYNYENFDHKIITRLKRRYEK